MKRFLRDTYLTWTERHHRPPESLGLAPRLFGIVAQPASWLYRAGVGVSWTVSRRKPFSANSNQQIAVIASPLVGGVGKSPLVAQLVHDATEQGQRVAVVTRGYAAEKSSVSPVTVRRDASNVHAVGDEAVMLAQQTDATVTVARYPETAIEHVAENAGVDLILLDDGVTRRWDAERRILVFTATDLELPIRYLPAGRWRIPPKYALPAHGVAIIQDSKQTTPERQRRHTARLASWGISLPTGWYETKVGGFARLNDTGQLREAAPPSTSPFAFCGLANPSRFQRSLQSLDVELTGFRQFPDHHRYSEDEISSIVQSARHAGADWLLTTHKDAVKIRPHWLGGLPLYILRISLELAHGADMLSVILEPNE
ncbi:MAG: tetraacyldisaccharide 4'-kinase [candidate division Zixibacteria bacterium]|nr:tetraacyldisaccharide 4'-kinase [candidate division Zixibacteria bacterium]